MPFSLLFSLLAPPVDYLTVRRDLTVEEHIAYEAEFRRTSKPTLAQVIRAERAVSRFPCIGPMKRWQRTFSFSRNPKTFRLDTSLIHFDFDAAGHRDRPAGRRISTLVDVQPGTDDARFRMAYGVYSLRTNQATLTYCGWSR